MNTHESIVSLIKSNRISTTEVSDALGKKGGILGVKPLNSGKFAVGNIFHCMPENNSNYEVHFAVQRVKPNDVVLITPINFTEVSIIGDLISKYCLLYRQASAIVVEGNVRDVSRLLKENYKIWSRGINPVGSVNQKVFATDVNQDSIRDLSGGIAVCDDGGVVVIDPSEITPETFNSLTRIEALEDLWQFCLNSLKWSTLDIIVNKRYLTDQVDIPASLLSAAGIERV
jgi:4-hydroxy-4-methyl-2-oxoglutarate aldolase